LLMLIGLPGAGKTTWAEKYKKEHTEKRFYIIGQDMIMGHLRNPSVRRNKLKWNKVVKLASDIFREQLKLAGTKLWNYIIDQTNVYAGARRDKLAIFDGYSARACVLVITDQELIKRCKEREGVMPKHIPLSVVDEMKKNFTLPHEDEGLFVEIQYIEQSRQVSESIVTNYKTSREGNNKPGILKMPGSSYPSRNLPLFRPCPEQYYNRRSDNYNCSDTTYKERELGKLATSVDNVRISETVPVASVYPIHCSTNESYEDRVYTHAKHSDERTRASSDEIPPLVSVEKKEKPEQIVHPMQIQTVHPTVNQQQPSNIHTPHLVNPIKQQPLYLPGLDNQIEKASRPGIIPMSKLNDHAVFSNHLQNTMYSAAAQQSSALQSQLINHHRASLAHLPFARSQTPVSSVSYPSPIGTPSFNQHSNSQQFLSQQNDHLLYSALTFPQSHPFQQMVLPQNHCDFSGVMALQQHSLQQHSLQQHSLQQSNIQDQFNNMTGYRTYNIHKQTSNKPTGR